MNGRDLLAWNLRKLRVERGLSQEKLAADTMIDRAYLGGLERRTENPTIDLLDRLAGGLSVEIGDLLRRPDVNEEQPRPMRGGRPKSRS